ncbi:unnamed protein product [Triticum turgidum subsp. durum]|uniref:Uncharacterized protein n=1 Tax=Triticum turgidum subsp. durum TaxID=4567 RepID=A0A9R0R1H4_TRITD|nr:unnamed protein product [Triticum turgidum subsp. durum]
MGITDGDLVLGVDTVWHDDLDHHACIRWICRKPAFQRAIHDPPVPLPNIAKDGLQHVGDDDGNCSAPVLLVFDPERILRPKLDLFASLGFEPRKLASEPFLLGRSLDKHLVPAIQFLRGIIGSDDNLRLAFHRAPRALSVDLNNNMRPAVEALRRGGLGEADISKLLVIHLGVLMSSPYRIGEIFEELKAMGMSILDPRFLYCFRAMSSLKRESWLRKLAFYQSFGLSEGEVLEAFKKQPTIFLFTDESINKKVRFLLDELKLGIRDVIARPVVLAYSLEKCILPRCAVLSVLMREGRIQRDSIKLLQALLGSSGNFSTREKIQSKKC